MNAITANAREVEALPLASQEVTPPEAALEVIKAPSPFPEWKAWAPEHLMGLTGELYHAIEKRAHRSQPRSSLAGSLMLLSLAAGRGRVTTPDGGKINLMAFVNAPSASGKENAHEFIKVMIDYLKWHGSAAGTPRSDKSMILDLLEPDSERCEFYPIDEAHSYLEAVSSPKANDCVKNMAALILELSTSSIYIVPSNIKREIMAEITKAKRETVKAIAQIEKNKDELPSDELAKRAKSHSAALAVLDAKESMVKNGVKDPRCSILFSSTKVSEVVTKEAVESGLLGRSLFFLCPEDRAKAPASLKRDMSLATFSPMVNGLAEIANRGGALGIDDSGRSALLKVHEWAEELRNDPTMGALLARQLQRVTALASLLAAGDGFTIKDKHVEAAYCLDMQSLDDMKTLLQVNEAPADQAIKARILACTPLIGIAPSAVKQRVLKPKRLRSCAVEFDQVLEAMLASNEVYMDDQKLRRRA
ncbi:MAG: hypothetical protein ACRC6D_13450 [Aeromonas sp.]